MPLFSVVIPTLNRLVLLRRTLDTVLTQEHAGAELIVVDDGSTDGTAEYLSSLAPRVRMLRLDHRGPGAARNAGAAVASGEYLAFLDSDDLWFPWTLTAFAQVIALHERPAYVCGRFVQFSDERALADCPSQALRADGFPDYLSTWPRQLVIGAGMVVVRRDAFEAVGGFADDSVNLEDHDLSLRLGTAKGFVQIQQPATMAWRLHGGGVTNDLAKSLSGCRLLIDRERAGAYPGGPARSSVRRGIITTHARSVSLECLKNGRVRDALGVYASTFEWHLSLGRWKYLIAFPFSAVAAPFRRRAA